MAKRKTAEEFIVEAKAIHGDKYDYSKLNYLNTDTKVTITCSIHGDFEQRPSDHLKTHGCRKCGRTSVNLFSSTENFIEKAKLIHNTKYDYSKVNYINNMSKVTIVCPIHGNFEQTPNGHLRGYGCVICGLNFPVSTQEEFIEKSRVVHNNKYDYSKVKYYRSKSKVTIICPEHGEFLQTPNNHLCGNGCPCCTNYSFDKTEPAILYYLKIVTDDNQVLYKIGITNKTVNERFNLKELSKIEVVKLTEYNTGQDAYNEEQRILKQFKEYQYIGPDILTSGNTELFTIDILI